MARKYRIELLFSAQKDIDAVVEYFLARNLQSAAAFLDSLEQTLGRLALYPQFARISKDKQLAAEGYRVALLEYEYLLFYKLQQKTVFVYRVIDGRRNYGAFI
ncbi:MAG: type II toxin-antitoxin system RelE/ParE family toxin [Candidatus Margulisbacteria bacterium]|jgi:plasmid stabilization system protein ParE|nr:type II toxin-antitoxin system RelE/ParE family toxin [Candidatus Margulisiibacteriota bacterium]